MTASMRIDQAGLPAGDPNFSREDGLATGALVTLTSLAHVNTFRFQLFWIGQHPSPDTTSIATLTQAGPTSYTFSPTASCYGTWRIELVTDEGTALEDHQIRSFAIKPSPGAIRIPAPNEYSDPAANLVRCAVTATRDAFIQRSETNTPDGIVGSPFVDGSWSSWWRPIADLIYAANTGSLSGGGATLILDPGGTPGGNVYTTFEDVVAAANGLTGVVTVLVTANATAATPGTYDLSQIHWIALEPVTIEWTENVDIVGTYLRSHNVSFLSWTVIPGYVAWELTANTRIDLTGSASILRGRIRAIDLNGFALVVTVQDDGRWDSNATDGAGDLTLTLSGKAQIVGSTGFPAAISLAVNRASAGENVGTPFYYDTITAKPIIAQCVPFHIQPPQITADQNDYAPRYFEAADLVELDLDAPRNITGFSDNGTNWPSAEFVERKMIMNTSAFALTLVHNSGLSTAGQRILGRGAANVVLQPNEFTWIVYSYAAAAWLAG